MQSAFQQQKKDSGSRVGDENEREGVMEEERAREKTGKVNGTREGGK